MPYPCGTRLHGYPSRTQVEAKWVKKLNALRDIAGPPGCISTVMRLIDPQSVDAWHLFVKTPTVPEWRRNSWMTAGKNRTSRYRVAPDHRVTASRSAAGIKALQPHRGYLSAGA